MRFNGGISDKKYNFRQKNQITSAYSPDYDVSYLGLPPLPIQSPY